MTGAEVQKLWELYPDVQSLYEQYNGIHLEDNAAWKELTEKAEALIREPGCTELKQQVILYTVAELERIARRRCGK